MLRFLAVIGGLLVVTIHAGNFISASDKISFTAGFAESAILFLFLAAVGATNGIYLAIHRSRKNVELFVFTQLVTDLFSLAILVYLTGGPGSLFTHFYFAVILAASLLGRSRSSVVCAGLAAVFQTVTVSLFAALKSKQLVGVSASWYVERDVNLDYFVSFLIVPVLAFFIVAILSNHLAVRLSTLRLVNDRVLRTMKEAVVICDRNTHIILFNKEARDLFGFSEERELEGFRVNEIFKRDTDVDLCELLTTPEESHREILLHRRNGRAVPISVKTSVITSYHGLPIAVVCMFNDMSFFRAAEENERRIQRLEAIRELSTGMSHEMRHPLSTILSNLVDLEKRTLDIASAKPLIVLIQSELERLDGIVHEFAEFSRKGDLNFLETNLAQLAHEAAELVETHDIRSNSHEVALDFPGPLVCFCEPEQIRRAIYQVAQNGIEAMTGGRLLIRGQKQSGKSDSTGAIVDGVSVEFYDKGKGIPEDKYEKIFEPFYGTKRGGAGLGLTLANRIIRAHGGEILFQSQIDVGTTFIIWLPANPRPQDALPEHSPTVMIGQQEEPIVEEQAVGIEE
jgi:two-component system sensor histidine kinase PilS (NtrC family)